MGINFGCQELQFPVQIFQREHKRQLLSCKKAKFNIQRSLWKETKVTVSSKKENSRLLKHKAYLIQVACWFTFLFKALSKKLCTSTTQWLMVVNVWLFVTRVWQHGSDSLEAPHLVITTFAQMQTFDSCVVKLTVSTPRTL